MTAVMSHYAVQRHLVARQLRPQIAHPHAKPRQFGLRVRGRTACRRRAAEQAKYSERGRASMRRGVRQRLDTQTMRGKAREHAAHKHKVHSARGGGRCVHQQKSDARNAQDPIRAPAKPAGSCRELHLSTQAHAGKTGRSPMSDWTTRRAGSPGEQGQRHAGTQREFCLCV